MNVLFTLPHVFTPNNGLHSSSALENAEALRIMMNALVALDEAYLSHHDVAPLYSSPVIYGRTNEWEPIPAVLARGYGDCKSLAAWLVAERRKEGKRADIAFRWRERPNGVRDYHIVVITPNGYEDPSKVLGMGGSEWSYFGGSRR